MNSIYGRIEMLIEQHRLTRKDFAEKIGISTGNLGDWKRGKSLPSASALIKIAEHFDISLDWLMRGKQSTQVGEQNPGYFFDDKWQFNFQLYELTDEEKQFMQEYLEFISFRREQNKRKGNKNG